MPDQPTEKKPRPLTDTQLAVLKLIGASQSLYGLYRETTMACLPEARIYASANRLCELGYATRCGHCFRRTNAGTEHLVAHGYVSAWVVLVGGSHYHKPYRYIVQVAQDSDAAEQFMLRALLRRGHRMSDVWARTLEIASPELLRVAIAREALSGEARRSPESAEVTRIPFGWQVTHPLLTGCPQLVRDDEVLWDGVEVDDEP